MTAPMADTPQQTPPDDAPPQAALPAPPAGSAPPAPRPRPQRPPKVEVRRFTAPELAEFDGVDGRSAFVAYKGFVFDVTPSLLWRNGRHLNEHSAGRDLTAEMSAAPHADDVMARFPIVGVLVADSAPVQRIVAREAPPVVAFMLRRHMHPVAVHYPMAAGVFAALFTLAALVLFGQPPSRTFEQVAWWLILSGAIFTFPAALTGVWSWWYSYGGTLKPVYRAKLLLTVVLAVLSTATVLLHALTQPAGGQPPLAYWAYTLLVLAHAPTVLALGWYGGKITYPD